MAIFARMVSNREPSVDHIIGFVDGLSIPVQCSSDPKEQSAHYNGYSDDTTINNVFAFAPTGKIIYAWINFPGSWHDAQVCRTLIDKVIRCIGPYALCVDQGFRRSEDLMDKFVGPFSKKSRRQLSPILREVLLQREQVYVSLHPHLHVLSPD
jgi:hypothetical protein